MVCPSSRTTMAFFHVEVWPMLRPRRRHFGFVRSVLTLLTRTSKSFSRALRISLLFAVNGTRNVYAFRVPKDGISGVYRLEIDEKSLLQPI